MEEWVFYSGVAVAAGSFLAFIVLSLAGSHIEKRITDRKTSGKAGRIFMRIGFVLFLLLGFSMVLVMVGMFFPLLQQVVPIDVSILRDNDMLFVFGAWAVYIIGLAIAFPQIKKDFLEPGAKGDGAENQPRSGAAPAGGLQAVEKMPGPAWPPLDTRIREAGAIVLADTTMNGETASYTVLEIWKQPKKGFSLKKGMNAPFSMKLFRTQGYEPVERQRVVFFIDGKPPYEEAVEILPVVGEYVMYAPADTPVQEYLELKDLKKRVMGSTK